MWTAVSAFSLFYQHQSMASPEDIDQTSVDHQIWCGPNVILQHLKGTPWFYFFLSKQPTFALFSPSWEIISSLVAVDLTALLSLSSIWQGLTVFTSHVASHVWLWMLMHRRRKKGEEYQEYNSNYQFFFLSLFLVLGIVAGLRIYTKKSNGTGGRKGGK